MTRRDVLTALAAPSENARYDLRPINQSQSRGVFDRRAGAFIPTGAIPKIDPTETWTGASE